MVWNAGFVMTLSSVSLHSYVCKSLPRLPRFEDPGTSCRLCVGNCRSSRDQNIVATIGYWSDAGTICKLKSTGGATNSGKATLDDKTQAMATHLFEQQKLMIVEANF